MIFSVIGYQQLIVSYEQPQQTVLTIMSLLKCDYIVGSEYYYLMNWLVKKKLF
jgi:hypothetical protein